MEYDEINETPSTVAEDGVQETKGEKKVNPTWEAFQKYKGEFVYVDPELL
ncbi:MAG: hypothetical protein IJV11_12625 [Muribaculaceae bacterium]|nr:hypothetical protein [Muribaculaceae bacterium]